MTKKILDQRRYYVRKRTTDNKKNTALTESQHAALSMLCYIRHQIHANPKSIWQQKKKYKRYLSGGIEIMLRSAGLPELYLGDLTSTLVNEERATKMQLSERGMLVAKEVCRDDIENINTRIENYLRDIDRKYHTWYAPSGSTRNLASAV